MRGGKKSAQALYSTTLGTRTNVLGSAAAVATTVKRRQQVERGSACAGNT